MLTTRLREPSTEVGSDESSSIAAQAKARPNTNPSKGATKDGMEAMESNTLGQQLARLLRVTPPANVTPKENWKL